MVQPKSNRFVVESMIGLPGAIASLGTDGKVPDGQIPNPTDGAGWWVSVVAKLKTLFVQPGQIVIRPEDYGAKGDGVTDDTAAVRAAFDAANALVRTGLTAAIQHPGATVLLTGKYNLATLSTPLLVKCNVAKNRAALTIPAAYAGIAVMVGHPDSGGYFTNADISLPDVVKPTNSALVAGSVGVRVQNLGHSELSFGRTYYFETGIHMTGWNQGAVYNNIYLGHIIYCKRAIVLMPDKPGGWVNQNTFTGGSIQQSSGYAGGVRIPGWRHLILDGNGINDVNMNLFLGTSFEGDVSEFSIEIRHATHNTWQSCRHEQGSLGTPVTVSGDTLTRAAHGLAVGTMITFAATTSPGGLQQQAPYFVVEVPTADTFKISMKKGGAAVTFTTAGAAVNYFRTARVWVDTSAGNTSNNLIRNPFTTQGVIEMYNPAGSGGNNVVETASVTVTDTYIPWDHPPHRVRNRVSTGSRPLFAAYPPAVPPAENPNGWTAALSDRGVLFANNEAETGRIYGSFGTLFYRTPADAVNYEIPSWSRHQGTITVGSLALPANTTTTFTFPTPNVSPGEHVLVTMTSAPAGVVLSHAYVSSAGNVTVVFANITAVDKSLNTGLKCMVARMYV